MKGLLEGSGSRCEAIDDDLLRLIACTERQLGKRWQSSDYGELLSAEQIPVSSLFPDVSGSR